MPWKELQTPLQIVVFQRTGKKESPDENCWNSYVNPYDIKFRSRRTIIVSSKLLKRFKFCQNFVLSQVYLHAEWLGLGCSLNCMDL